MSGRSWGPSTVLEMPITLAPCERRTYRLKFSSQCGLAFMAAFCALMGWGCGAGGIGGSSLSFVGTGVFFGFALTVCALGFCFSVAQLFRSRLSIDGDTLSVRGALGTVAVNRTEVAEWYIYRPGRGAPQLVLRASDRTKPPWRFPYLFETDLAFDDWLNAVPEAPPSTIGDWGAPGSLNQPAMAPGLDHDQDDQLRQWHSEVSIWAILHIGAVVMSAWVTIARHPSDVLLGIVAALPLAAAMLVAFCGRPWTFSVESRRPASTLTLVAIPAIASIGLFARAPAGFFELDPAPEIYGAVAGGLALLFLFSIADRQLRRSIVGMAFALPPAVIFAGAVILCGNARFDQVAPREYAAHVLSRSQSVNSHGHAWYRVTLAPWGPVDQPLSMSVNQDVFNVAGSKALCIDVRTGIANIRWIRISACEDRKSTAADARRL